MSDKMLSAVKSEIEADSNLFNTLMIDHEPVDVFHDGAFYTVSINDLGMDAIGTIHLEDTSFIVYPTLKKESPASMSEAKSLEYKFDEGQILDDVRTYVNSTYGKHYAGRYQATDMIMAAGHGIGFCVGNIMKYAWRVGKKGGYNEDDVMKVIHYALILMHIIRQKKD